MDRLVSDTREDVLDYILTVNIFNEGVDLPDINQVIMLRLLRAQSFLSSSWEEDFEKRRIKSS